MAVDQEDVRSANRPLELISCDGDSQLHLPSAKFQIHYLVGAQALISFPKMGNGIPNRRTTTWSNTNTRPNSEEFYEQGTNQEISIREMGVEAFNDFVEHLSPAGELKREE